MEALRDEGFRHVSILASQIGNRLIGSPGNKAAAEYITQAFLAAGLSVDFQEFPCPDWAADAVSLTIGQNELPAVANTFSPSCHTSGPLLPLGTTAELECAEITGRMLLFYGELAQHELAAGGAIYVPERDRRIVQLMKERSPAGLILVNPTLHGLWRLAEDYDLDIPSVTVSPRVGLQLIERTGEPVHLSISTRRSPSFSGNVIGRLPGRLEEKIVLCAHYDTKEDTPGAYDNAAGVAALLATASRLGQKSHRHTIEWIAFSGEEGYGLGDMEYARRTGDGFDRMTALINLDGVGPKLAVNTITTFSASEGFHDLVRQVAVSYPGVAWVDPWPASDHYIFYSHGVPSIAIGSLGIQDIYHTPEDTLEWISPARLAEATQLTVDLVASLDEQDLAWGRSA